MYVKICSILVVVTQVKVQILESECLSLLDDYIIFFSSFSQETGIL